VALGWFVAISFVPALWALRDGEPPTPMVEGRVTDSAHPVAGARVRWQGSTTLVLTDADGRFHLPPAPSANTRATAQRPGYRIGAASLRDGLHIRLDPLPAADHPDYPWISPHPDPDRAANCANCHTDIYREWSGSAHAGAARNPRFLQLFADPDGKSPHGWDLSREHPLGMPVCTTCHAPTLDDPASGGDVRLAAGVAADGVHCDYCHKVVDAPTDKLGVRFGRDGLVLLRPRQGEQLFYGPLDDAVRPGESFGHFPVYKESRVCAPCHEGIVFGVHVYGTYSEWLDSPARAQGIQCQGCHMRPTGRLTNIAPGKGGIERDPLTLASHRLPGSQEEMLRRCLRAEVTCRSADGQLRVEVTLRAEQVGHRVPTGFIDRHLLLIVQAFDHEGAPVPLTQGPRLPAAAGRWSGQPGWLYGKLLRDERGHAPLPFWLPGSAMADTRLYPAQPDVRSFVFAGPAAQVQVRVWYRRFWQQVADARGWTHNDMLVFDRTIAP
jgi:hypothetical protein